jgi:hypothetical protein
VVAYTLFYFVYSLQWMIDQQSMCPYPNIHHYKVRVIAKTCAGLGIGKVGGSLPAPCVGSGQPRIRMGLENDTIAKPGPAMVDALDMRTKNCICREGAIDMNHTPTYRGKWRDRSPEDIRKTIVRSRQNRTSLCLGILNHHPLRPLSKTIISNL